MGRIIDKFNAMEEIELLDEEIRFFKELCEEFRYTRIGIMANDIYKELLLRKERSLRRIR